MTHAHESRQTPPSAPSLELPLTNVLDSEPALVVCLLTGAGTCHTEAVADELLERIRTIAFDDSRVGVAETIEDACRHVVPKKLAAELDARNDQR